MKLIVMLVSSIIVTTSALAGTQNLAHITNDEDKETIDMVVVTDGHHDVTHLKVNYKNTKGKVYKSDLYEAQKAANGVVLFAKKGKDIVKLSSGNFSAHQGGDIKLNYLVNGITGSRGNKFFDLSRDADSWSLKVNYKKVRRLHFSSNKKPLVGTVGIRDIKVYH